MIRYHGGPVTPVTAAASLWTARHAFVSLARLDQLELAAEVAQSFALDNGAFSAWRAGEGEVDFYAYSKLISEWCGHPGFDFCIVPDVIGGTEFANQELLLEWRDYGHRLTYSVPVWHMHESLEWLEKLVDEYPRVAIGSSGQWPVPGKEEWWKRIEEAMSVVCDENGHPMTKLHGLRMMNPTIFSVIPFASVDSCQVARNIGIDKKWEQGYLRGMSKMTRAVVLADRMEQHACASRWSGQPIQETLFSRELLG